MKNQVKSNLASLMLGIALSFFVASDVWAGAAYCFPANWWGHDLLDAANGQATTNDVTCGCGGGSQYWNGSCNGAATTRSTSAADDGAGWWVKVRSDYSTACSVDADMSVSGGCYLSGKNNYSSAGSCSDHYSEGTLVMSYATDNNNPCTIEYKATANKFRWVVIRDVIKFNQQINVSGIPYYFIPPASWTSYAPVNSVLDVTATATVAPSPSTSSGQSVTITSAGNCGGGGVNAASITMGAVKSGAVCTLTYSVPSATQFEAKTITTTTRASLWLAQSINFPAQPTPRLFVAAGTFPINPVATGGSSSAPIFYSSLSPAVCTVSGTTVTMVTTGTCVIAADKGPDDDYGPAPQQAQFVEITKAQQYIEVTTAAPQTKANGQNFTVAAVSKATATGIATGLAVNITVQGSCAGAGGNSPQTFTMNTNPPGVCTVLFQQNGNGVYERADPVTQYVTLDNGGSGCFGEGTYTSLRLSSSGGYMGWACNGGSFIAPGSSISCSPKTYWPWIDETGWSIKPGIGFKGHVLQTALNPGKTFVIQKVPGWDAATNNYYNILNTTDKTCIASGNGVYEAWSPRVGSNSSAGYMVAFQDSTTMPSKYCDYTHKQTKWKINSYAGYITLQTAGYPSWPASGCIGSDVFGLSRILLGPGQGNYGNWGDTWVRNAAPSCGSAGARITCGGYTPPPPNHIRFEFNSTSANTCQATPITIRLCANAAPGVGGSGVCTPYNGYGVLKPLASKGTWAGLTMSPLTGFMSSSSGVTLSNPTPDTVSLGYSNKSMALADSILECYDTASDKRVSCAAAFTYKKCADFDAVEQGAVTGTNLYTKIAGRAFNFDVVGAAVYTGNVTVSLVDVSGSAACSGAPVLVSVASPYNFVAGDAGRKTFTTTYAGAARNVAVKMVDKNGKCYSSSDTFTIRPKVFGLTGTFDNPHKAGKPFSLVATARNDGGATTTQYTDTPAINDDAVMDITDATPGSVIASGTLVGSFPAAVAGVSTGTNAFKYNNIGMLRFPLVTDASTASAVEDTAFTAVDQAKGDCIAGSYSNTIAGGKYGCNVGSVLLDTNRFIPDHYEVNYTLAPNCGGAAGFTYFDQAPATTPAVSVKAMSLDGVVLTRVTKDYPLPALGSYSFTLTAKNGGVIANPPTAAPVSMRMSPVPSGGWPDTQPGGSYENLESYSATTPLLPRQASPANYENFTLETTVTDPDNIKITWCNGIAVGGGGTTVCPSPSVRFRHGVLKLDNAYGSELLPLNVPVRSLYWNGSAWAVNTLDSCTSLITATSNAARNITVGNYKGHLTSADVSIAAATVTLAGGLGSIRFAAPGAGKDGSADIALNLNDILTHTDSSCVTTAPGWTGANATNGAYLGHLKGAWCGSTFVNDPSARITFGTPKSQFLYMRERF